MKNIKSAISLVLLMAAPAIYAQNINTKSNPELPAYTVTLNVTNNGGGTDSVKIAKSGSDAPLDSLLFTGSRTGSKLNHGTKVRIGLQAESGKKIKSMTVTKGEPATTTTVSWDASSTAEGSQGTVAFDAQTTGSTNYYSLPLGALNSKTDIAITWEDKATLNVTCEKTVQTVKGNNQSADAIVVKVGDTDKTSVLVKGYYTTAECKENDKITNGATDITKVGTYYVKLHADEDKDTKAFDMVVPLIINSKLALTPTNDKLPKIDSVYQEGQSLASVAIAGGTDAYKYNERVIKGTWAWAEPNQLLTACASKGSNKYQAVFTPDSSAIYNSATAEIAVDANKVATVTLTQTTGGAISIENATPDNKYVGTTLGNYKEIKLIATPAVGYKFVKWVSPNNTTGENSESKVEYSWTPTAASTTVSAEFAKATREVKLGSHENGNINVLNGSQELDFTSEDGATVDCGTALTIVATPNENYEVSAVGYSVTATRSDNPTIETTSFVAGGQSGNSYTVSAVFKEKPKEKKMISLVTPINGSVALLDANGEKVNPNSSVDVNSTITVIAMPNKGYKLAKLLADETDITAEGLTQITADTEIKAIFTEEEYTVTVTEPEQVNITGVANDPKVKFGTSYQSITASINPTFAGTHKLVSLLINNSSVTNGTSLKVEGPTVISAQVEALVSVKILNKQQTEVVYNGSIPAYAISTATGLGGFEVSFRQNGQEVTPTAVGTYDIHIYREHDNMYATYSNDTDYKLVIKPGVPGIKKIALLNNDNNSIQDNSGEATVAGIWTKDQPTDRGEATLRAATKGSVTTTTVYFVPDDKNIGYVKAETVTESEAANAKSVTINYSGNIGDIHGTVSVMNGTIPVTSGVQGLKLKVVATADKGYIVSGAGITTGDNTPVGSEITVKNEITITVTSAAFTSKKAPSMPTSTATAQVSYGKSLPAVSGLDTRPIWSILYKDANGQTTDAPKEIGTYTILASCDEGDTYAAVSQKSIGTLTINQADLTAANVTVAPTASPIVTGDLLSSSLLSGGQVEWNGTVVAGTFSWPESNNGSITKAGDFDVVFTPQDNKNYKTVTTKAYVSLLGVQSYKVTFTEPNIQVTDAQKKEIKSGDKVTAGMKLYVTPTGTSKIIKELTFGDLKGVTSGKESVSGAESKWYCIAPAADFSITVVFESDSSEKPEDPDKPEDPENPGEQVINVTGITLNKTTLTLEPKASFELVATISPKEATQKEVKWLSTDPTIATVTSDGTVKAVNAGKTTIIATTVDGGFTALCEVTVNSTATGIEKILSESRIYGQEGSICIEPAIPVDATIINMNGKVIYKNSISATEHIPADSGIYIVRLSTSDTTTTTKVIVK